MKKNAQLIFHLINHTREHPSAEEIHSQLRASGHSLSLATVYNNLHWLLKGKFIRRIPVDGGSDRYDRVDKHDHLQCVHCGQITDVILEDYMEELERQLKGKIVGYDLKIQYICPQCQEELALRGGVKQNTIDKLAPEGNFPLPTPAQ
ncbi:MAG: Fur family transcriptional regulator [Tissierellia bacterium]|nr:Fur family transcriptional regulator [Tissierellia bacterium]